MLPPAIKVKLIDAETTIPISITNCGFGVVPSNIPRSHKNPTGEDICQGKWPTRPCHICLWQGTRFKYRLTGSRRINFLTSYACNLVLRNCVSHADYINEMAIGLTHIAASASPGALEKMCSSPKIVVGRKPHLPKAVISGFTLIELTIVLVVIGILAAIAIPNYILMVSRAKESKVKENAHCVQLAVELYATENDGIYSDADDASIIANIVPLLPGQQRLKNPFSGNRSEPVAGAAANAGEVGYQATMGGGGVNVGYTVTGFGRIASIISLTGGF